MTLTIHPAAEPSPWSPREAELLAVALRLLQERGYQGLTVDAVAAAAHASKATVYRRWHSKAELVLAAFVEGTRHNTIPPDTGTLRGDLLRLAEIFSEQDQHHASTIRAVLIETTRNPALNDAIQHRFLRERKTLMQHVLQRAMKRGELVTAISDELWDLLPGYLTFRYTVANRPPTHHAIESLVDDVLLGMFTSPTE
ncbi:TetR family transcriptional regulator [Mycobacterium sp. ENV421]|uniref:TetR/AcrR family transcriptional regulator n=1 Tax=Mycobacterium sp. ENV421 TaxID=1213407 RepID=UPI000C9C044D|nr:TetR/AcrR family transcriptional regulator [Mycobacterium sp. ENV421]PND54184.1 TetR family transcriptional regulator [Mycobacterium sp. ENV421]